jgi:hypothetical protein
MSFTAPHTTPDAEYRVQLELLREMFLEGCEIVDRLRGEIYSAQVLEGDILTSASASARPSLLFEVATQITLSVSWLLYRMILMTGGRTPPHLAEAFETLSINLRSAVRSDLNVDAIGSGICLVARADKYFVRIQRLMNE